MASRMVLHCLCGVLAQLFWSPHFHSPYILPIVPAQCQLLCGWDLKGKDQEHSMMSYRSDNLSMLQSLNLVLFVFLFGNTCFFYFFYFAISVNIVKRKNKQRFCTNSRTLWGVLVSDWERRTLSKKNDKKAGLWGKGRIFYKSMAGVLFFESVFF